MREWSQKPNGWTSSNPLLSPPFYRLYALLFESPSSLFSWKGILSRPPSLISLGLPPQRRSPVRTPFDSCRLSLHLLFFWIRAVAPGRSLLLFFFTFPLVFTDNPEIIFTSPPVGIRWNLPLKVCILPRNRRRRSFASGFSPYSFLPPLI